MSFPIMNKRSRQGVSIPDLAGGINLRDSLTTVQDNQLTDAVNMWFRDGALRTRPSFVTDIGHSIQHDTWMYETRTIKTFSDISIKIGDNEGVLACVRTTGISGMEQTRLDFFLVGDVFSLLGYIEIGQKEGTYFVFKHENILYCLCSDYTIYKYSITDHGDGATWIPVKAEEYYAPTVFTNGLMGPGLYEYSGDMFEGENIIGYSSKYVYSTVNTGVSDDGNHLLDFVIPIPSNRVVVRVEATLTGGELMWKSRNSSDNAVPRSIKHVIDMVNDILPDSDPRKAGNWRHEIRKSNDAMERDNLWMAANQWKNKDIMEIGFSYGVPDTFDEDGNAIWKNDDTKNNQDTWAIIPDGANKIPDNFEIIVYYSEVGVKANKVFDMNSCTWFGGASAGLNGGTRLFLCGNTNEGEENLVLWSGLNEPLYFSENCYAYVGDKDSRVTAFGKQSDMLVIFKENETYFTRYTRNNSITAEALIDQSVVDYTANSVYFPLTLIHSQIGCDLPDSIQLCRNRLVWTKTNGKVYTLVTNDQYSERNIYEVGEMAERHIKENTQSNTVSSSDWEGYYVLFCGANMYLMDYNSSGYQYIYSYQKNEDANVRIPWYKWHLPYTTKNRASVEYKDAKVFYTGSHLWVFAAGNSGVTVYWFDTNKQGGDVAIPNVIEQQIPIHSSLTTKLFDFGAAGYRKNVDTVQLMLGNNGGAPISVGFVTDCGTEYDEISLDGDDRDSYSAGHISALTLSPCIRSVLRFGVKLESDGPLIVDGMTLGYRILGGAR